MPPESRSTWSSARSESAIRSSSSSARRAASGPRDVEVAREDQQVLAHRQLEVERGLLGDDAELALQLPRAARRGRCPAPAARRRRGATGTTASASWWSCRPRSGRGSRSTRPARCGSRCRRPRRTPRRRLRRRRASTAAGGAGSARRAGPPDPSRRASAAGPPPARPSAPSRAAPGRARCPAGAPPGRPDRQGLEDDRRAAARDADDHLGELEDRELARVADVHRLVVVRSRSAAGSPRRGRRRSRTSGSGRRRRTPSAACPSSAWRRKVGIARPSCGRMRGP